MARVGRRPLLRIKRISKNTAAGMLTTTAAFPSSHGSALTAAHGGTTTFIDFAWHESMHGVEFEGFQCHGGLWTPFHRDRERLRRLTRAGWTSGLTLGKIERSEAAIIVREVRAPALTIDEMKPVPSP